MGCSSVRHDIKLSSFITKHTRTFFTVLTIPATFLFKDPEMWSSDSDYIAVEKVVKELKVVNDNAEGSVPLIQELYEHICHNEEQKQFVLQSLQVVSQHSKMCVVSRKSTVAKSVR